MHRYPALSLRTLAVGLAGLVVMAGARTTVMLDIDGGLGTTSAVYLGETLLAVVAAIIATTVAVRLGHHGVSRRAWGLLALAIGLYAVGNLVWDYLEIVERQPVPYPGSPDVFYILSYLSFAAALLSAIFAYRDLADVRPAIGIAITSGVVLTGLVYFGALDEQVLSAPGISGLEKSLSVFYTTADVLLLMVPALALVVLLFRLNAAPLAWPWGLVCLGTALLAVSDTAFAVMSAAGTYIEGGFVNFAWMAAHLAFALGASIELDMTAHRAEAASGSGAAPAIPQEA